jgi:hypothetical protein
MREIFGQAIAVILLALYVLAVCRAVALARKPDGGDLGDGFTTMLQSVGSLLSALVVATLGLTASGKTTFLSPLAAGRIDFQPILVAIYLIIWLAAGLASLYFGWLRYPGKVQPLTDAGKAWFGLALAAGFAVFGLASSG